MRRIKGAKPSAALIVAVIALVAALGGGAVVDDGTRQSLLRDGIVITLTAAPAVLAKRGTGRGVPVSIASRKFVCQSSISSVRPLTEQATETTPWSERWPLGRTPS